MSLHHPLMRPAPRRPQWNREARDQDSPGAEEAEPVLEGEKTGPSMAGLLAANLPKTPTCREMLPSLSLASNLVHKLPPSSHNVNDSNSEDCPSLLPRTLPLEPTTTLTTNTTNALSVPTRFCAIQRSGHARLAGLSSI